MDLRSHITTDSLLNSAMSVLNYQPFVLTDNIQTGVAWSWKPGKDPRVNPTLIQNKASMSKEEWDDATALNNMLRSLYNDLLDEAVAKAPGGTLLDVACNNGYFPVGAEIRGMHGIGMDIAYHYGRSVSFLNSVLGTKAEFISTHYDSIKHNLPIDFKVDITVMTAIMCHIPDPLHFLGAVAAITKKMLIFWGQVIETDSMIVAYNPPHSNLSRITDFPNSFNDNTRISTGMFKQVAKLLGFSEVIELKPKPEWTHAKLPNGEVIETGSRFRNVFHENLHDETMHGSGHKAILLVR